MIDDKVIKLELKELETAQDKAVQRLNALEAEKNQLANEIVERRGAIGALQGLLSKGK